MFKRFFYRGYARTASYKRWIARRLTPAGQLAMAGVAATMLVGFDTTLNVAYLACVLLVMLLLVAVVGSLFLPPRLDVERVLPRFGTVGTTLRYDLHLTNRSNYSQDGLTLFEDLPDPRPRLRDFLETPEPGEEKRNILDRQFGYYRWQWLVGEKIIGSVNEAGVARCPPKGRVSVSLELMPLRRGVLRFEGVTCGALDPFGLFRSLHRRKLPQSLLILPKRYWLPSIALPGTRMYQRGGVALASSVGESDEFVSLRDYRPGDPLKHVHWRSWARVGRPIVKEFQDEHFVRHALVLDTFSTLSRQAAFEEAVSVAASFACTLRTQESLLDLMFVGAEAHCFTVGRGLAHTEQMLEVLAGVKMCPDRPFRTLQELVWQHIGGISGCILVFIKWDHERIEFVRQLQALGVPVMVLVVAASSEARDIDSSQPGPGSVRPHVLEVGKVQEGLAKLS